MVISRLLRCVYGGLCFIGLTTLVQASLLIGTGTLNSTDDLTIVQAGSGTTLEWLDLSTTDGMSVVDAVSAYQGDGFRWATGGDIAELYAAFGITYGITSSSSYLLGIDLTTAQNFVSYLGATSSSNALGWIDDLDNGTNHTHDCIGSACNPYGFVSNVPTFWPSNSAIGVYMVRDSVAAPIPAAPLLFGSGLLGLLGIARRRKVY
jgi:hypothetical protein